MRVLFISDTEMSRDYARDWSAVHLQYLYDVFVKYVDELDPSLRKCVVCLCVANPYERVLRMECCKATTLHFSCWFDAKRGVKRTVGEVNRDVESLDKIPLNEPCPTCQTKHAHAVEIKDHLEASSKIEVVCKLCEGRYTSVEWLSHWQTCSGGFIRIRLTDDVEACVADSTVNPCDSRFWQLSLKTKQMLAVVFIFLAGLLLASSVVLYG